MRLAVLLLALCACAPRVDYDEDEENAGACGTERWVVKTASDGNAAGISQVARPGLIEVLVALTPPAGDAPETTRVSPTELRTYQLTDVDLLQYDTQADRDYHLVLGDGTNTMIAEIPDPGCVNAASPLLAQIKAARAAFDAHQPPIGATPVQTGEKVTIRGVAFFDRKHDQTGVADNAIELHPVTFICFGAGCEPAPPPVPDADPPQKRGCASAPDAPWFALLMLLRRKRRA